MPTEIIDAHVHCGRQSAEPPQDIADYRSLLAGTGISAAAMFAPVMEVYDRHDPHFQDTPEWQARRARANAYLLSLSAPDFEVIPYFFIWNDFAVDQLAPAHRGIKWHRHPNEPTYRCDDPHCRAAIQEIRRRNLPVCLEESLENTLRFVNELAPGVRTIIPHCGRLNGGYEALRGSGVWERPNIYTDTSPSRTPPEMIADYIRRYGHGRILFGSDFPFGTPRSALDNVLRLRLPADVEEDVLGRNLRRLLAGVAPG